MTHFLMDMSNKSIIVMEPTHEVDSIKHLQFKHPFNAIAAGPSGSGKTTLMNIIGLLDKPDQGDIVFGGKSLLNLNASESARYRNKNIGFIFQDHLLLPHLTVWENIFLPILASDYDRISIDEIKKYIDDLIDKTGISGLRDKFPFQISGGEAQRVTLVRALVNRPAVLLADEPTGSLDTKNAEILGDLLINMNQVSGITLIVATHSTDLACKMAVRLKLDNGILIPV